MCSIQQNLEILSIYDKCVCSTCNTSYDKSPKGMYRYTDDKTSYIVCAICVLYKGIHKNLLSDVSQ